MPTALPMRLGATLLFGIVAVILMALRIWASADGFVTPDSTQYLAVAESLLADQGFSTMNDGRGRLDRAAFAIWPAGYPTAISAVAALSGASVFTASKILNFSLFIATLVLISASFGRNGFALSVILCFGAFLDIFSYTWSEGAFLFFSVLACILAARALSTPQNGFDVRIVGIGLAVLGLFLCRYIGAYAIALPVLLCLLDLRARRYRRSALGVVIIIAVIGTIIAYLLNNQALTGHLTGIDRVPAPETNMELFRQLALAVIRKAILPLPNWDPGNTLDLAVFGIMVLAIALCIGVALKNPADRTPARPIDPLAWVFLFMGFLYLAAIIFLRWRAAFDGFGFRLLAPGSLLVFLGAFHIVFLRWPNAAPATAAFLASMAALSLAVLALQAVGQPSRYNDAVQDRLARYDSVPEGAILVFADLHTRYLRPDLHLADPIHYSASGQREDFEPWQAFLDDLAPDAMVFVEIGQSSDWAEPYHPSVSAALSGFSAGDVIALQ